MWRGECRVKKERGRLCGCIGDKGDGVVGDGVCEVVIGFIERGFYVVARECDWIEIIRRAVNDPILAVEAAPPRPVVLRFGHRRYMPLA